LGGGQKCLAVSWLEKIVGSRKKNVQVLQPIRNKSKSNRSLAPARFPALIIRAFVFCFPRSAPDSCALIGALFCSGFHLIVEK